jgi:hypothetical protein
VYKVALLSTLLNLGITPSLHEGEGNFELYIDLVNGVGGLEGAALSLLWTIGGLYFIRMKQYFPVYIAVASLLHFFFTKGNVSVYLTDLGLSLFLYGLLMGWKNKYPSKRTSPA